MRVVNNTFLIKPLNLSELEVLIQAISTNEEPGFVTIPNRYRNQMFVDYLKTNLKESLHQNPEDYLFYTIWLIIRLEDQCSVGHMFFNGSPNLAGEVELYFEVYSDIQQDIIIKESMDAITVWASNIEEIETIKTIVPAQNPHLSKSMVKTGFEKSSDFQYHENWIWKNEKITQ